MKMRRIGSRVRIDSERTIHDARPRYRYFIEPAFIDGEETLVEAALP
jgi:hypothetical protein